MTALRTPEDLLATELKEIHSAERQLSRVIPRLSKKASSERLRELLDERLEQGERLIEEIESCLEEMETPKARPKNLAAEGLIEDVSEHMQEIEEDSLIDPFLIAAVQKIEHYCIAAWGTAAAMGRLLEQENVVKTMEQVLKQGKRFDQELTKLAEEEINPQMMEATEGEEEGEDEGEDQEEEASSSRRSPSSSRSKSKQRAKAH
jgi:ferritin-like metal-binding protein YciE